MRNPLGHHHGDCLCASLPALVHGVFEHLHRDAVPPDALARRSDLLFQCEVAVQLQVEGVVLPNLGVRGLVDDLPGDMQLRALRVEVEGLDTNLEGEVHPGGGGRAGLLGGGDAADGTGAEEVARPDEVIGVPLRR